MTKGNLLNVEKLNILWCRGHQYCEVNFHISESLFIISCIDGKLLEKKRRYDRASQEKCPTLTVFYVNHNRAVLWSGNERKIGIIRYDNTIRQHCCNLFCWPAKLGDQMLQPVSNCLLCVQITNILPDSITALFMKQVRILRQRTSGEISLKNQSISMFTYQQIHNINYVYMFNSERVFK